MTTTAKDWSEGYTAEVDYIHGYYREMSPSSMDLALTLAGHASPDLEGPFRYCELGYGNGVSLNVHAACYPRAEFWGTDFNPGHAARARSLASAAGLTNIHLLDDSFAELLDRNTPQFDYVALHGVYSWVSPANQARIVEFLKHKLRPGGVVYVSYNCLPGWAARGPVQHLLAAGAQATTGPVAERIKASLTLVDRLVKAKAEYFGDNPGVRNYVDGLQRSSVSYLSHELLVQDFRPFYSSEIAAALAPAKLSYAASATMSDHVDIVNYSDEGRNLLAGLSDPTLGQTVRDYLLNRLFRRDLFVKGLVPLSISDRNAQLTTRRFALKVPRADVPMRGYFGRGEVTLQPEVYGPILDGLARGPMTAQQLVDEGKLPGLDMNNLLQALTILVAMDVAEPAIPEAAQALATESVLRFNEAVMNRSADGEEVAKMASSVLGSAVNAAVVERLLLKASSLGEDLPTVVFKDLSSRGLQLIKEGKPITSEEQTLDQLRDMAGAFMTKLHPLWKQLGVIRS